MKNRYLYITLLTVLGFHVELQAQNGPRQLPRIVVSITIDQLNSDDLEALVPLYGDKGFRHLLEKGTVYENASYPLSHTDRASAISSLFTGTTPYYHGITGLRWLDRETLRPVFCTDGQQEGPSPDRLMVSTIGDELKVATQGRAKVFAIAPYEDAAILSAGHAADGAIWMDGEKNVWTSSKYYANETPTFVLSHNNLKREEYKRDKHRQASPRVNADVTELAMRCVSDQMMGYDEVPDLLCLTYHAVAQTQQPADKRQEELRDTYIRLDRELGNLISWLEGRVGAGQVLFILTGTGYTASVAPDYTRYRIPTGTFYINRTVNLLNMFFGALWGQGRYVEASFDNQLYLNHKLLESRRISLSDCAQRAREFVAEMSGVRNVYTALQLKSGDNASLALLRNGFHPERCGDLLIEVAPGWHLQNEDTGEDQLVEAPTPCFPIIIYGGNARAERVITPVSTIQIAPTIARAIRIRAPNACTSEPLF